MPCVLRVRNDRMLSVLYVDLDNFRRINEVLGHVVGDEMMRHVAQRLQEILRRDAGVGQRIPAGRRPR